jgi:hypothetical protein
MKISLRIWSICTFSLLVLGAGWYLYAPATPGPALDIWLGVTKSGVVGIWCGLFLLFNIVFFGVYGVIAIARSL